MSRDVWVEIALEAQATHETINIILTRFKDQKVKYIDEREAKVSEFNIQEATSIMIKGLYDDQHARYALERNTPVILCEVEQSYFSLVCVQNDNKRLSISIALEAYRWYKGDPEDRDIDYDRYLRLLLDACQDFPITRLKTSDTYYDYNGYRL